MVTRWLTMLLVLISLLGCSQQASHHGSGIATAEDESVVMPTHQELPELKMSAMQGSGIAALRLSVWYMKFPEDDDTAARWTQVAAENGSKVGQYNLAMTILGVGADPLQLARAKYWLGKSAEQGSEIAEAELRRLESAR